jgi:hypothetical protein
MRSKFPAKAKFRFQGEVPILLWSWPVGRDCLPDDLRLGATLCLGQACQTIRLLVIEVDADLAHIERSVGAIQLASNAGVVP